MANDIVMGRMSADVQDRGVVLFLLGAQIKKWWAVHKWIPVALAMLRMQKELRSGKVPGYLGSRPGGPVTIQYWASMDALLAYARDHAGQHFPAWADFHKRVRKSGAVGVWHETFIAEKGAVESVYVDVSRAGLGEIFPLVPATGRRETARGRLEADQKPGEPNLLRSA
jgi:hypothetical protein